ncbi:MAG: hypothetical protein VKK63_00305 [Synechococcus sp.]|nr:hypothetical protein [Synechococcus sp.]
MSESRAITKMLEHARILINAVEWREAGIKAEDIIEAGRLSYGGRLTWSEQRQDWDYCTGSYYPVEYRKAVCSVMAMCLIQYWFRDGFKASEMHSKAVIEFGKSIANRWFK